MNTRIAPIDHQRNDASPSSIRLQAVMTGLAGGLAEVFWILMLGLSGQVHVEDITRAVALTLLPDSTPVSLLATAALGIHFGLSVLIGIAFVALTRRLQGTRDLLIAGLTVLMLVWAVNFFLLLPLLGSPLPAVLPLSLSFVSKALFALAMVPTLAALRS